MANYGASAMFFAGLILLIPHRIGMSRVNYVIKRYNLPISRAGLLLYKFHNPIEVSLFIGNVLGAIITISASITNDPGSSGGTDDANGINYVHLFKGGKQHRRDVICILMFVTLFLMLLSSIYMFIIYVSGDDYGYLDHFYFSLILITFFDGFTNAFAFCINGENASLYALGIPTSGALVSLLHNIYKFFSDYNNLDNFDYYVLFIQLFINIITILITLGLWAGLHGYTKKVSALSGGSALNFSPILLLAISLGTVYAFYPSIAPYSIIDYQYASVIELWILIISSSPTVLIAALDYQGIGPGSDWTGNNVYWHLVWLCAIPYILCIQIFMTMLHYPHSLLSSFFKNPLCTGFISILFNFLREGMQACGFAGAGQQGGFNGGIASINKPITLFVMMFCVFTGDGYLQHYRRCCRDCWPTTGYTKYQSFRYWLRCGFKGGSKSFTTSFTDMYHRNIRPQIISYA